MVKTFKGHNKFHSPFFAPGYVFGLKLRKKGGKKGVFTDSILRVGFKSMYIIQIFTAHSANEERFLETSIFFLALAVLTQARAKVASFL